MKTYLGPGGLRELVKIIKGALSAKQDTLKGSSGQFVGFDESGRAVAVNAPGGGGGSYVHRFTAEDWAAAEKEATITIPAETHKLTGALVLCSAFCLRDGVYYQDTWAARATYAAIDGENRITLHCQEGYAGAAILSAYN